MMMRVQRRPTRRNHLGRVLSWTYWVIMPKQGMLDFVQVAGRNCWARVLDECSLGLWPGERPPAVTRPVRIRDIAYRKNGKQQLSYGLTIPIIFTGKLRPGMTAGCLYMGDHLRIVFGEPVFAAHVWAQRRAEPLMLKAGAS